MTTPALQSRMLAMLEETREEILSGELESLSIIARKPRSQSYFCLFVHEVGADICALYGFLLVALQKNVVVEQETERVTDDQRPISSRAKVVM